MKMRRLADRLLALLALLVVLVLPAAGAAASDLAVRAGRLMTGTGETIPDGVVVIEDGRIRAVGPARTVRIPADMEVIEVPWATPGLVDGLSVVGLAGALNQDHDQDQLERSAAMRTAFGDFFVDGYVAHKRAESAVVADLSPEAAAARYAEVY